MLFASIDLAARIERADASLVADAATAVGRARPEARVAVESLAGGVAVYAGNGSPLNKVAGVGFGGPVAEAELEAIEAMYAARDAPVQVELSSLADPTVAPMLTGRGYALVGFENVLGLALDPSATARAADPPGVSVRVCRDDELERWLDTAVTGFATPDLQGVPSHESFPREVIEGAIRDMVGAKGFVRYLAFLEGAPAGAASVRLSEGVAQMSGAATLPEHRRRGVQSALLAHRLADATAAGCDVAVVTVQPGSKSQENVQRKGFELLYTRAVLVLEPKG